MTKSIFLLTYNVTSKRGKFIHQMTHVVDDFKTGYELYKLCKDMHAKFGEKTNTPIVSKRHLWSIEDF